MSTTSSSQSEEKALARELLVMLGERRDEFLGFVKKRVWSGADAEDLLQQSLLRAAEKLDGLREGDRVDAWFYRVLRNTIADHMTARAMRESKLEQLAREVTESEPADAAVCACAMGVLGDLKPEYESIIRQVDLDGDSLAEAAASLGIEPNNAKVRLHRARKSLKDALLHHCGACGKGECESCCCD